jgi:hypothetical protein
MNWRQWIGRTSTEGASCSRFIQYCRQSGTTSLLLGVPLPIGRRWVDQITARRARLAGTDGLGQRCAKRVGA